MLALTRVINVQKNKNTVDFNENDSDSMRKTICSTPTRCVKMNELNEGEIQEKIDALNLHYDQIAEESGIENNINKNKHQNNSKKTRQNINIKSNQNDNTYTLHFARYAVPRGS